LDRGHYSSGNLISNNYIQAFGGPHNSTRAIYLDDEASYNTCTGNVICGSGQDAIQIHGGDHNVFRNNIIDLTDCHILCLYQDAVGSGFPNYGMSGNRFTNNVVYSNGKPPRPGPNALWYVVNESGGTIAMPCVSNNLYFSPAGAFPNNGTISDSAPINADPLPRNAAAHDYTFAPNSPAMTAPVSCPQPSTEQGPL